MARWSVLHLITLAGLQLSQTLRLTYISLPTCWKFQLQSFSLKSQPLESQPIAKVCQNGHLLVMQPLSHGKENGEATGLVASAWNQQLGRSKGGKSHQAARQGLIVSPCTMVRWGEADDSLRLRYAAPTRLILRRPLEKESGKGKDRDEDLGGTFHPAEGNILCISSTYKRDIAW